jgi:phosphatidylethanolamine-binding protein (PEBP) family uncharacterized protein
MRRLGQLCFSVFMVCSGVHGVLARDSFDRPSLDVPKTTAQISIAFADADKWDGKHIDRTMQCKDLGGDKPASPKLTVSGVPSEAASLVVFFANPRSYHNHGTFRVRDGRSEEGWKVPSIRSGAGDKLPKGIEIFDGGSTWGRAYNAPCPTAGSWLYTVTVYALDAEDKVIAVGDKDVGYAP